MSKIIPVVGDHDYNTKSTILKAKGGVNFIYAPSTKEEMNTYSLLNDIWPQDNISIICFHWDKATSNNTSTYLMPIDLGDNVLLSAETFKNLAIEQLGEDVKSKEKIREYFIQLTDENVELYKLMYKMDQLERDLHKGFSKKFTRKGSSGA